jgi:hypothetical protein
MSRPPIATNVLQLIGHTPMVRLNRLPRPDGATVVAKVESLNPGGSVKDRIALAMVEEAERRGVLRALPYLNIGDRGLGLVDDAIRTNDTRLIAAALGPYATRYLPDAAYDQAVLKCVFVGVPISGLDGIPERVTPDGARMLGAFVHERVAAGRDVPAEVWIVIDRYPPHEEIAAIEAERESRFEDRRAAAERALSYRVQERA